MLVAGPGRHKALTREAIVLTGPRNELANYDYCCQKDQKDQIQSLRLEGKLKIRESGFYQFVISTRGRLRIKIDNHDFGERIVEATNNEVFLPLSLEAGWHRLYIELVPDGRPHLKIVVAGNQVAEVLAGKILRHVIH